MRDNFWRFFFTLIIFFGDFSNLLATPYIPPKTIFMTSYYGLNGYFPGMYKNQHNELQTITFEGQSTILLTHSLTDNKNFYDDPASSVYLRLKYHILECHRMIVDTNLYYTLDYSPFYHIVIDGFVASNINEDVLTKRVINDELSCAIPNIGDTLLLSNNFEILTNNTTTYLHENCSRSACYNIEYFEARNTPRTKPRIVYNESDDNHAGLCVEVTNNKSENNPKQTIYIHNQGNDTCLLWFSMPNINLYRNFNNITDDIAIENLQNCKKLFDAIYKEFSKGCSHSPSNVVQEFSDDLPVKVILPGETFGIIAFFDDTAQSKTILPLLRLYDKCGLRLLQKYYNSVTDFDSNNDFEIDDNDDFSIEFETLNMFRPNLFLVEFQK